ncbi:hypothetical protein LAC02_34030 [Ligilactobacillus acidipiscis]|nr:hypothetical protein LAC02_34030 [Ligilactobacillus acidipiscis]
MTEMNKSWGRVLIHSEIDDYHRFRFLDRMTYGTWLIEDYMTGVGVIFNYPDFFNSKF